MHSLITYGKKHKNIKTMFNVQKHIVIVHIFMSHIRVS